MRRVLLVAMLCVSVTTIGCSGPASESPAGESVPVRPATAPLEDYQNGLSNAERQEFYHLSEGGEILPLAILRALERPRTPQDPAGDGPVPFTQNLERYGFIPDDTSSQNPFGLPTGMTVARSRLTNRVMVGFNCATCHVGEIWKNGRRVRIDGGPNMIRLNDMLGDVKTELAATLEETGRRERFLVNVVRYKREDDDRFPVDRTIAERVQDLKSDLETAQAFKGYIEAMPLLKDMATVANGYGRVDAFGVARNLLFGANEKNRRPQNAPVSLSYIWGMENTAWLQWGANMNSVMERNIGQSLGVGAVFDSETFATTARLDNLNKLEHLAYRVTPPAWPEALLGAIDQAKAARGRDVYDRSCANCHEKPFATSSSGLVTYQLFKLSEVGTSPLAAQNFDETVIVDGKQLRFAAAAFSILERLKRQYYVQNAVPEQTQAEWEGRSRRPAPRMRSTLADADKYADSRGGRVYPAKPLAGIWATAPYLNNGSVANMWDLLTAPESRPTKFALGSREYDSEKLGYVTSPNPTSPAPAWEFDTTKPSNSNAGHVYGTKLPDDDKWALIEFLKALRPGDIKKDPVQKASGAPAN
jgi:processive rubber oxygenase RoxA-like protein